MKKLIFILISLLFILSTAVACTKTVPTSVTTIPPTTPAPGVSPMVMVNKLPDVYSEYGKSVNIELTFVNKASEPRLMGPFPPQIEIIVLPDVQPPDIIVRSFPAGVGERLLQPGEAVSYNLTWNQLDNNGEQAMTGWYGVQVKAASRKTSETSGGYVQGIAAKILVQSQEPVMEKTLIVDQSQTISSLPFYWKGEDKLIDVTVTLTQVEMSAGTVKFTAMVTSPAYELPQGIGLIPPQWMLEAHAQYIVDGINKSAGVARLRPLENGVQLEWGYDRGEIDTIPGNAKELTFIIPKLSDWLGPWEFKIPLE
jgi:hypothetical protein